MLHGLNLDLGKGCSHGLLARSVEEAQEGRRWALTLASQAVEDAGGVNARTGEQAAAARY